MQGRVAPHESAFVAENATIMIINVHQLGMYMSMVPPAELVTCLAALFSAFDGIIDKFPAIRRVGILGDVYIAAAGLFLKATDVQKFTEDMICCASRCLDKLEEISEAPRMSANLQLRIGIHTGGPVHAGVTENGNVFSVAGAAFRCAHELEHHAIPGSVNISAATYDHIASSGMFSIEPHEEIDMPSGGRTMTYTIAQGRGVATQSSKYKLRYGTPDRQGFTMPSVEALINVGPVGFGMGDHALIDPNDAYEIPGLDGGLNP
jgi:class 3 adenylate cyclase